MNRRNLDPSASNVGQRTPPEPLAISLETWLMALEDLARLRADGAPAWMRHAIKNIHAGIAAHTAQLTMPHAEPRNVQGMTRAEFEQYLRVGFQHDNVRAHERGCGPADYALTADQEREIAARVERNYPAQSQVKHSITHVTSDAQPWNYDMQSCPIGAKVWLLNMGGVATTGPLTENMRKYFAAWAPMPRRDKAEEKRRGLSL